MNIKAETIERWENIEVERSTGDAQKRDLNNLGFDDSLIKRYTETSADTFYALEYAYHLLGDVTGKTVLDYGCGAGENSVLIAKRGGNVTGVDISPELLEIAAQRMNVHDIENNYEFKVGSAHDLPIEDESVDVVFGMAILHHLDLELSSKEVFRVLKKGSRAIFLEPVRNSKLIKFVRKMIPYQSPDVSPFERPLTEKELEDYAAKFTGYELRAFSLPFVNLMEVLKMPKKVFHSAIKVDGKILKHLPQMKNFASVRVIQMRKP